MGFDCTLHLVDQSSFGRFTSRFLRDVLETPAFDDAFDVDDLIAETKVLMTTEPERGAKALGDLALLFASSETPHIYSRGFSLSLWYEDVMGAEPPTSLMGSVEAHLREIIAAYPQCAGHVPDRFTENFMVGPFVAASNVPKLLAYVENTLEAMVPGDRKAYLPLRDLLRVGVERGLAYWEGTDLGVVQAHEEWLARSAPTAIATAPHDFKSVHIDLRAAEGSRWLVFESWRLHDIDISTWPPTVLATHEQKQVTIAAPTPWNTLFMRVASDPSVRPYVFENLDGGTRVSLPWEPSSVVATRDALLAFPECFKKLEFRKDQVPLVIRPSGIERLAVPLAKQESLECFATTFPDDTTLVIWDGAPYRWDGATVTPLGGVLEPPDGPESVVGCPDGSIVGGFGRKLLRIDPEGIQTTLLPLDNVMQVGLGPEEALILVEGGHPESDVMKVYWTGPREITLVEGEVLGIADEPRLFYYDAARSQLVFVTPKAWCALPWAIVAALPRVSLADYTKQRAELVERSTRED